MLRGKGEHAGPVSLVSLRVNAFLFLINLFILFIYGCIGSLLLHVGFLQLQQAGATLLAVCGLLTAVASLVEEHGLQAHGLQQLKQTGFSSCGSWALECRLSSCGTKQAQLLRGMWDLPRPGLEPMSPALAGGFLTTAPPGKSSNTNFKQYYLPNRAANTRCHN